jgi:hypothetical protein
MATHTLDIAELQALCAQSVVLNYNLNAADTLEVSLKPEAYAALQLHAGDRVILKDSARWVFSGTVQNEPSCSVQAGDGEVVTVSAASDWALLEKTVYAKQLPSGEFIYPGGKSKRSFMQLDELSQGVLDWATDWEGTPLEARRFFGRSALVPVPEGGGLTSCADVISEALAWAPHIYMKHLYTSQGTEFWFSQTLAEETIVLDENSPVTSINLTERKDLVPTVCALVGGEHYVLPKGGDIREPGAFVYAVPLRERENAPAGSAEASQKMEVRGVALPERSYRERTAEEYREVDIPEESKTMRFLRRFFPQYNKFLPSCKAGALVASIVTEQDMKEEAETELEEGQEYKAPANYSETPENWAPTGEYTTPLGSGVFVLTDGSFTASTDATKNLKGLRWCKAKLEMQLYITLADVRKKAKELRVLAGELFPGKLRGTNKDEKWETRLYARLSLDCVLINSRKRLYDPATNKPFRSDPEWEESAADEPTESDYKKALLTYYNNAQRPQMEGDVTLLLEDRREIHPVNMLGLNLSIYNKREEWETLEAVIRSVSWAYGEREVTLSVGPREVLGFEEELRRILLEKFDRQSATQRLVLPFDALDSDAQDENEQSLSVSPNISASVSAGTSGKARKPWTLYEFEDNEGNTVVYMAGGNLYRAGQHWNVPDSAEQFTREEQNGEEWDIDGKSPRIKWELMNGTLTWSIYQPKED